MSSQELPSSGPNAVYMSTGHLVWARGQSLRIAPFYLGALELTESPRGRLPKYSGQETSPSEQMARSPTFLASWPAGARLVRRPLGPIAKRVNG